MPHLTKPFIGKSCLIQVWIGVSQVRKNALIKVNKPVPKPQLATALVDTGASISAVDPSLIAALSLVPTGTTQIHSPTTGSEATTRFMYDVSVFLYDQVSNHILEQAIPVTESVLKQPQGFDMLLGCDVLADCLFVFDGRAKQFILAF